MKKIFFFTVIAVLTLSSCRKEATTSLNEQSPKIVSNSTNSVNAVPTNYSATFPANEFGPAWNSCTQEFIDFSGTGHVQVHGVTSDNKTTYIFHVDYQNVKGVGRTSGTEYVASSTFNFSNTFNSNTQVVYQQNGSIRWIAQGSGISFTVINDWHLTINANGDVTRFISTFGDVITCQ
jgi:hypothetical protein